jgi:oxygen-independent coproporphyrinogen-3 oxidase
MYMERARAGHAVSNEHAVAPADRAFEFMLNALRLVDGFEMTRFVERTGLSIAAIDATLERAVARGLLQRDARNVRPTARGLDFLSDLQQMFL